MIGSLLILASCALAHVVPFELILFSYAFLGPAHYLTQISWLHDRKYYSEYRWFALIAVVTTAFAAVFPRELYLYFALSLLLALIASGFKSRFLLVALLVSSATIFWLAHENQKFFALITILLPTVIHIYVFTAIFIFSGWLKRRELGDLISLIALSVSTVSFFALASEPYALLPGWVSQNVMAFDHISHALAATFNVNTHASEETFLAVRKFIAFAYTHHYLNWFSKTELLAWHKVPKMRLAGMSLAYVIFIGIYIYDYQLGLTALFFLSALHVVMEFPLNILTIKGLFSRQAQIKTDVDLRKAA